MNIITSAVKTFINDEEGVTLIEYGLLAALIAAIIGALVTLVSAGLTSAFTGIGASLTAA